MNLNQSHTQHTEENIMIVYFRFENAGRWSVLANSIVGQIEMKIFVVCLQTIYWIT